MSITITTAAEHTRLCTIDELRESLSITDKSKDLTLILMIDAATSAIQSYCETVFARQEYTEVLSGSDTDTLILSRSPIIGTPIVLVEGEAVVDFEVRDSEWGMLYREVGWKRTAWVGWDIEQTRIPLDAPTYSISYEAGYLLPEDGEENCNLPANIRLACNMAAAHFYRRDRSDADVVSKKVDGFTITYRDSTGATAFLLPAAVRSLLPAPRVV